MQAKRELWNYGEDERVWVGKYKNSRNLPHWHDDCELIFAESGEAEVFCDGVLYEIKEGQAMFICGGQVHSIICKPCGVVLTTLVFSYEIIKPYFKGLKLITPVICGNYPILEAYDKMRKELLHKQPFYRQIVENEISKLMLSIFRSEKLEKKSHNSETHEDFKKLLDDISINYDFYNLARAAKFMNMNVSYFSRFFHLTCGMPFSKYLNYVKVEIAINKIKERKYTVTEIASACGFGTIRNFNRTFKFITGYSPTTMPQEFKLSTEFINKGAQSENPSLFGCELIESVT